MGKSEPADSQRFVIEIPDGVERGMAFKYIIRLVSGSHTLSRSTLHTLPRPHTLAHKVPSPITPHCARYFPPPPIPHLSLFLSVAGVSATFTFDCPSKQDPYAGAKGPAAIPGYCCVMYIRNDTLPAEWTKEALQGRAVVPGFPPIRYARWGSGIALQNPTLPRRAPR